jgi:hypothetical protein
MRTVTMRPGHPKLMSYEQRSTATSTTLTAEGDTWMLQKPRNYTLVGKTNSCGNVAVTLAYLQGNRAVSGA